MKVNNINARRSSFVFRIIEGVLFVLAVNHRHEVAAKARVAFVRGNHWSQVNGTETLRSLCDSFGLDIEDVILGNAPTTLLFSDFVITNKKAYTRGVNKLVKQFSNKKMVQSRLPRVYAQHEDGSVEYIGKGTLPGTKFPRFS